MRRQTKYIIGIDEVGRGPLAGPVSVCSFALPLGYDKKIFAGVKDSKKLSAISREKWVKFAKELKKQRKCFYAVSSVHSKIIDRFGIVRAVRIAIKRTLKRVLGELKCSSEDCQILLDGSLKAPKHFRNQTTIIKGDSKVQIIGLASVVAKVHRDAKMSRLAKEFPGYGFEIHKGYGTSAHIRALKKYGPSPIHRRSFIKNFV